MNSLFLETLHKRLMIFDGATGTSLQAAGLTAADFDGLEGCNEILNATRPDVVASLARGYFEAGADAVETNTFGANCMNLGEYGIADRTRELSRLAASIAKEVAAEFSTPDRPRFVVGSMGPGTKLVTMGMIGFDELLVSYRENALGLIEGGADALMIETCQDLLQAKCAVIAACDAFTESGGKLPLIVSVTMESNGKMLLGTEIGAALTTLEAFPEVDIIGLNCATGPQEMVAHVRYLSAHSRKPISVLPNAGLPQMVAGKAHYPLTPEEMVEYHSLFVHEFGVNIVGGCCGTTTEHIRAVSQALAGATPARRNPHHVPACASLYQQVPYRQDTSFLIVGERTNANGSRKFRDLLLAEDWDEMAQMARDQEREGAHVLDVCMAYVGRDEVADVTTLIPLINQQATIPIMIDSTQPEVMEAALKLISGKPIVNSVNLEDGGERLRRVLAMCRKYGAAVVALTIDEEGMAKTVDRKLQVAERLHRIATEEFGISPEDIFFDALTFTLGSGDEEFRGAGVETITAVREIKRRWPECNTLLGVSNISFGLKPAARTALNSVFLHYALEAGLDAAIVHAGKIVPLNRIEPEIREIARRLVFDERVDGEDPLHALMALFREDTAVEPTVGDLTTLPVEERLQRHIVDGVKTSLEASLDEALLRYEPLAIINDILLQGMKTVGELFASGEMQLPFVLQSAEVMKRAVAYLQPKMKKVEGTSRGKLVLATVAGDVHDIGKNLVDIILSNNGYEVVNLGIKQPIANILKAYEETGADAIGMSGLLVKSTLIMRENLEEMNRLGLFGAPVLLGGAALTRSYVENELRNIYHGKVFYAQDAFEGLYLMGEVMKGPAAMEELYRRPSPTPRAEATLPNVTVQTTDTRRSDVSTEVPIPEPPFWGVRVVDDIDVWDVYPYVNSEVALFRGQWQMRRGKLSKAEFERLLEEVARPTYERLKKQCAEERLLVPKVVYGYFPAQSEGNDLIVYQEDKKTERVRFTFPRQPSDRRLCLADFFAPRESGKMDVACFTCVTVGSRISEYERERFDAGDYQEYLYLHGMGVETAEGLAEYWHKRVREELGIADKDAKEIRLLFSMSYQGARYSFGYPACPNLEDQRLLFDLLDPRRIGVELTEECHMVPEQSTSAIICHHPEARYFNIR
ncbi:MAG: methionine synthase [Fimbriimonadia bacterium]|jgi:5-methyltetrahydrofolate--homocysteine methyltransferase